MIDLICKIQNVQNISFCKEFNLKKISIRRNMFLISSDAVQLPERVT